MKRIYTFAVIPFINIYNIKYKDPTRALGTIYQSSISLDYMTAIRYIFIFIFDIFYIFYK